MNIRLKTFLISFSFIILNSYAVYSDIFPFPNNYENVPNLNYPTQAYNQPLTSPVSGKVIKREDHGDITTISIACTDSYYLNGILNQCNYELIISGIKNFVGAQAVSNNQQLGTITDRTLITSRSNVIEPYMLRLTDRPPVKIDQSYYFTPSWFIQSNSQFLSFRQVMSFEDAINDFYTRWKNEDDSKSDSFATIHYFPEKDRIRIKIKLENYPINALRSPALGLTEMRFYGSNLFIYENSIPSKCEYQPVIYWQKGFLDFIKSEYRIGDDIYIYCSIYTLDHQNKRIIVCAREFSLHSDEEIIDERMAKLK
jgi:hypothetical protein